MFGLLIDTSTEKGFIALTDKGFLVRALSLEGKRESIHLTSLIDELLSSQRIDYIGVGCGPGAFIGTRVGVLTAKTLAFSLQIPLVTLTSLLAYCPEEEGPFTVALSAKSRGFYTLNGVKKGGEIFYEKEPQCSPSLPLGNLVGPEAKPDIDHFSQMVYSLFLEGKITPPLEAKSLYLLDPISNFG